MKAAVAEWFRLWILIRRLKGDKCHHPAHYVICDLNPTDYAQRGLVLPQPWFVVQSFSHVQLFATPWTAACQASLSFTISQSFLKLMFSCLSKWCHQRVDDATQPSHPLLPPSLPALSLSQYQGLWLWMYQPASHISATQLGLLNVCFYDHGWLANEPGPELRFHLSYCWCVSVPDYAREELVFPSLSVQRSGVPLRRLTLILLESLANDPGCNRQWGKAHLLLTPSLRISL